MTVFLSIVRFSKFLKVLTACVILWCCLFTTAFAQLNYSRSTFDAAYVPITLANGAVQIVGGSGANNFSTTTGASNLDDGTAYISLPFNFNYAGTTFTSSHFLAISTNGFLYFSTVNTNFSKISIFDNTRIFGTLAPNNCLAPYFDDLKLGAVGTNPAGEVLYKIFNATATNEDTLVIQYTNISSSFSALSGMPKQLNFQVWLYKNSGQIEFRYGSASGTTFDAGNESASIGIENGTGGMYNFIDGITGSTHLGSAMLTSNNFPNYNIKFTPGTPLPIPAGTYTVGAGGAYKSLTTAIADLNHRGVSGNVIFNLTDTLYSETVEGGKNIFPLILEDVKGTSSTNKVTFQSVLNLSKIVSGGTTSTNALVAGPNLYNMINGNNEPIIALFGTDYITFKKLCFTIPNGNVRVDRGIWINNITPTNGATNNSFVDVEVKLNRDLNLSSAIYQSSQYVPITADSGANSNNTFYNFSIKNCVFPITLLGSNSFPDNGTIIGTTSCTTYNTIGDNIDNDINNDDQAAYGIKAVSQTNLKIFNTTIRNITSIGAFNTDGIVFENPSTQTWSSGNIEIYNNKIYALKSTSTAALRMCGMRINVTPNSTVKIYNNWITDLNNASISSSGRNLVGVLSQSSATATNVDYYIEHNNINLNPTDANCSNVCIELGTKNGINHFIFNNIFSNKTPNQTSPLYHSIYYSPGNYSMGTGGFNYNSFYFENNTGAFFGVTPIGNFPSKADWDGNITGPGPEQQTIECNPQFASDKNDLHTANLSLNSTGTTPSVWITTDIDCNARTAPHDIGATLITTCNGTPTAGTAVASSLNPCAGSNVQLSLIGNNFGPGISFQWQESLNGTIGTFSNIAGATNNAYQIDSISMDKFYRCYIICNSSGIKDSTNILNILVRALPSVNIIPSTASICQPNASAQPLTAFGGATYSWAPAIGLSSTVNKQTLASPSVSTTYTVTATSTNGCTKSVICPVIVSRRIYINDATATPTQVCSGGSSQLSIAAGTTSNYAVQQMPYTNYNGTKGKIIFPINTNDDYKEINLPSKFLFDFFGKTYDKLFIQVNGFVSFGAGSTFKNAQTLPNSNTPNNVIALCQSDLLLSTGSVDTFTIGTFPNRKFVISYDSLRFYINGNPSGYIDGQLVLLETQNIIESHLAYVSNGTISVRSKTMGIENETGTVGIAPPSRNDQNFQITTAEGWRYVPSGGNPTYSWSPVTNIVNGTTSNPTATNITANTTYIATATESGGCKTQKLFNITVSNINAAIVNTANYVCEGNSILINAGASSGIPPYNYLWSNGSIAPSLNLTLVGTSSYTVTVTDAIGCTRSASQKITFVPSPQVSLSSNSPVCAGTSLIVIGSGALNFDWAGPQGFSTNTSDFEIQNIDVANAGDYIVTCTDSLGCSTEEVLPISVLQNDMPLAGSNSPVIAGDSIFLNCTVADSYYWEGPSGFASTLQNPILANASQNLAGTYTVTVTKANGCTSSASVDVSLSSARMLGEVTESSLVELTCYPNPAKSKLFVSCPSEVPLSIKVFDNTARLVLLESTDLKNVSELHVEQLATGIYTVQILTSSGLYNMLFTKN